MALVGGESLHNYIIFRLRITGISNGVDAGEKTGLLHDKFPGMIFL